MNIFYLHPNPQTAARMHCDKHCVKMILEYAQLLSTAHRDLDGDDANTNLYKIGIDKKLLLDAKERFG